MYPPLTAGEVLVSEMLSFDASGRKSNSPVKLPSSPSPTSATGAADDGAAKTSNAAEAASKRVNIVSLTPVPSKEVIELPTGCVDCAERAHRPITPQLPTDLPR